MTTLQGFDHFNRYPAAANRLGISHGFDQGNNINQQRFACTAVSYK